jgi:hypothetical protein
MSWTSLSIMSWTSLSIMSCLAGLSFAQQYEHCFVFYHLLVTKEKKCRLLSTFRLFFCDQQVVKKEAMSKMSWELYSLRLITEIIVRSVNFTNNELAE